MCLISMKSAILRQLHFLHSLWLIQTKDASQAITQLFVVLINTVCSRWKSSTLLACQELHILQESLAYQNL